MSVRPKRSLIVSLMAGGLAAGCSGEIGQRPDQAVPSVQEDPGPGAPPASPPAQEPAPPAPPPASTTAAPPFELTRERLRLLPFETRLRRLVAVTGLAVTDPLVEAFRARRVDLGDGDYALGINPDSSWTGPKMLLWAKLLRPVCASMPVRTRYPQLATDASALMSAAYGRPIEDADRAALHEGLVGLPAATRGDLACVSALSSAEFLAQ